MRFTQWISTVDTHTEGQATRIVTNGIPPLPGGTMVEKLDYFAKHFDHIRTMLISEPRGHRDMYGCILTPPISKEAQFGVFFMDNAGYMNMCGHGTIGVCTALLELGMIALHPPSTEVRLETPSGMVVARASVRDGRAESICFRNVPAYVEYLDQEIYVPSLGKIPVDVAYGGNYFVFFLAEDAGLDLRNGNMAQVVSAAMEVMESANRSLSVHHPTLGNSRRINIATVLAPPVEPSATYRNVHVFGNRQFDRSPGGTGTSARLAVLYSKGAVRLNQEIQVESITGGVFTGRIVEETNFGDRKGFVTEVQGSAFVTGFHQFFVDPQDRLKKGFLLEESQPGKADLIRQESLLSGGTS